MRTLPGRHWLLVLALPAFLGGCAEVQLAAHAVKSAMRQNDGAAKPAQQGLYKVGEPYQIEGAWYYPKEDYRYDETGIASWYGADFHRKRTANGEIFDMNAVSAAHPTLPLPSVVRVTNLENGRSLVLRVNDRGPFRKGRVIDLSKRGAELLGVYGPGTAKVRVQILPEESRKMKDAALRGERLLVQVASLEPGAGGPGRFARDGAPEDSTPPVESRLTTMTVDPANIYVRAGSFALHDDAARARQAVAPIAPADIVPRRVGDQRHYQVRIGPLADVEAADRTLDRLVERGYPDARIVVE